MTADKAEKKELPEPSQSPSFLEVFCKSSGKIRRFASGTEAGFALYLINLKRGCGTPHALHIEAAKEGEESISFGPNAVLVDYGEGWKLQTVPEEGYEEPRREKVMANKFAETYDSEGKLMFKYIGKVLLAFGFIFLLGGSLTLLLENLPKFILFITSSM
ncbi:maltase-glucoamylase, intestinal protein [Tasmannia lanceolata]|uniref:maltase-glucoamylase, intestinal protein n=1 Tax=Tasmannia lanceolata TaxID=3420 RepID=UPI0040638442